MVRTWRQFSATAVVLVGLAAWAAPALADSFVFDWIDTTEGTLRGVTYRNGNVIQDVTVGPEDYSSVYFIWDNATLASDFNLRINIYESDRVTLSDTWQLSGGTGSRSFSTPFHSDTEGNPLLPLEDAINIVETGDLQTVFKFLVNNPTGSTSDYTLQFASDATTPVPEPASLLLLGTGLFAGARRWRKRQTSA